MKLRRKLFTIFGSLALLSIASGGVTLWGMAQWFSSEDRLQAHYQRSLLALHVKATTYRAIKELLDATVENDKFAREDFEEVLRPVKADLQRWTELAHNDSERQQIKQVQQAYTNLIKDARTIFHYVQQDRRDLALRVLDGELEEVDFPQFEQAIVQAIESDQQNRQIIRAETRNTRQTSQFVLTLSAFGILSLVLLLAAYLSADLFIPLQETEAALDDVTRGNIQRRLNEERQDELGAINRAFNRMIEAIAKREQTMEMEMANTVTPDEAHLFLNKADWDDSPSRLTLHQLVFQLRSQIAQLHSHHDFTQLQSQGNVAVVVDQQQTLMQQIDQLLQVVARVTEFGFPLDLNLACTDIRVLLHEVLLRFHQEFIEHRISFELSIAPEVNNAVVDRLKLREVLAELVRNALSKLPDQGGRLGLRAYLDGPIESATHLLIELADNGAEMDQSLMERVFATIDAPRQYPSNTGFKLAKAIVKQHGGTLIIDGQPGIGKVVQIQLPWHHTSAIISHQG